VGFRMSCVFVCHVFSCGMCFRASCVFVRHVFNNVPLKRCAHTGVTIMSNID
jgi:hypothetical protein